MPEKILRLMTPHSYYCIIGTFLQEIDFRVRFANNERAGTGLRDCPAVVRNPIAGRTPWSDRQTLEQTLLDSLYKPFLCGGPEVVFEAWQEAVGSRRIDEERLLTYLRAMNYPATTRRLAVMLELAGGLQVPSCSSSSKHPRRRSTARVLMHASPCYPVSTTRT